MEWSSNVVRSLGWDPRHHKEVRNGPENKIHIWKVIFRGSEKYGVLTGASRKFWKNLYCISGSAGASFSHLS
jgi:hypothetical protein